MKNAQRDTVGSGNIRGGGMQLGSGQAALEFKPKRSQTILRTVYGAALATDILAPPDAFPSDHKPNLNMNYKKLRTMVKVNKILRD